MDPLTVMPGRTAPLGIKIDAIVVCISGGAEAVSGTI